MSLGLMNTITERMHVFVHACTWLHFYVQVCTCRSMWERKTRQQNHSRAWWI